MFADDEDAQAFEQQMKEEKPQASEKNPVLKYTDVELPSKGMLGYPEEVSYRDILVRDEKELSGATPKTFPKVLNTVLKNLLHDPSIFDKLTIHDRDFLILWIWANNYSTVKHIEAQCPHCGEKNQYQIDLTQLDVKELDPEFKNPYPYTTKAGEQVTFRLLTTKDEEVARHYCNAHKNENELQVMLYNSVQFSQVMPLKEKIKKIENEFTGKDMAMLRGFHAYFKYGIQEEVDRECGGCGEVSTVPIPFQIDFFLPSLQGDFGKTV